MTKFKRISLIVLFATISVVVSVSCERQQDAAQPIKIGADITLTGPIAYWGQQIRKGLDLALEEVNKDTSSRPIEILYQDNQGEAKNAIAIFQRFATVDNVSAATAIFTPVSKPLRPLAARHEVPLLATVVSAVGFGLENDWSFRDFPSQTQQATAIAEYAYRELGLSRAAVLVVNDDYGRDGERVFTDVFTELGGEVVEADTVDQRATDIRAQLTKLLAADPDTIFMVVRDTTLGIAVKQARELSFDGTIVGVNAFDAPVVWEATGTSGDGVIFTSAYIDYEGNPEAAAFVTAYRAAYEEEPDWVAVYGYTIGQYLFRLAREAEGDPRMLREKLSSMRFDSIRGELAMNTSRDVVSPIGIYERQEGGNALVQKITPTE